MKPVAYLAGPMTIKPNFNYDMFTEAARNLRAAGWKIWSPLEHDVKAGMDPNNSDSWGEVADVHALFAWDMIKVIKSPNIILLPDWFLSKGVAVELSLAQYLKHLVFRYEVNACTAGFRLIDYVY